MADTSATLSGAAGRRRSGAPARSWRLAAGLALLAVYLPQLAPLVLTNLLDNGPALGNYVRLFPILVGVGPGLEARMATDLGEPWEEVVLHGVAALVTLGLLVGTTLALRRSRWVGLGLAGAVAFLSTGLSMLAASILRI